MENRHLFKLITLFFLASIALPSIGQQRGDRFGDPTYKERIISMKIAFITERLSLSPSEAEKFWPVYNEAQEAIREIQGENKEYMMSDRKVADMSEEETAKYAENEIKRIERMAALQRKYHEKYLEILPLKKVALLYEAEKYFHHRLFRQMRRKNKE